MVQKIDINTICIVCVSIAFICLVISVVFLIVNKEKYSQEDEDDTCQKKKELEEALEEANKQNDLNHVGTNKYTWNNRYRYLHNRSRYDYF
jgi:sensor domain CHASE-containing protein